MSIEKQFKFKVKHTTEATLQIYLNEELQKQLKTSDLVLIREYLQSFGIAEYTSMVESINEEWEILHYEEILATVYTHNVNLAQLDICFFTYEIIIKNDQFQLCSNFIYDNKTNEDEIKAFIIKSSQHSDESITIDDIHNLTINR